MSAGESFKSVAERERRDTVLRNVEAKQNTSAGNRAPRGFPWPIEVHGYTKVFLTYFGPLNTNFEGDKCSLLLSLWQNFFFRSAP